MRHHHHLSSMSGHGRHILRRLAPHLARIAMSRHQRGGFWGGGPSDGFGPGGPDGPGGFDNEGWRRGRKFSADDLQLLLLSLLEEKPSHGYELIKALETRTNGFYKPSPGVVYPR